LETISVYDGEKTKEFIEQIKKIYDAEGEKSRGAKERYRVIIAKKNKRGIFMPTVSTRRGTETIVIYNLTDQNIIDIEKAIKGNIPLASRECRLYFDAIPAVLPNETKET